jgi:hypothetical protein
MGALVVEMISAQQKPFGASYETVMFPFMRTKQLLVISAIIDISKGLSVYTL